MRRGLLCLCAALLPAAPVGARSVIRMPAAELRMPFAPALAPLAAPSLAVLGLPSAPGLPSSLTLPEPFAAFAPRDVALPAVLAAPAAAPRPVNAAAPKMRERGVEREHSPRSPKLRAAARAAAGAARRARAVRAAVKPDAAGRFFDGSEAGDGLRLPEDAVIAPIEGVGRMVREIREPGKVLRERGIRATITVFGSARIKQPEQARRDFDAVVARTGKRPTTRAARAELAKARTALRMSAHYEEARRFGALVAKRGGGRVAVVTGGGPGIMEAANRGAFEAGGPSVGYNIELPHEQSANPYLTPGFSFDFKNFATRKMNLRQGARALVVFPGGFGTMDELFELVTLIQTGKHPTVPIVLMGKKAFWDRILNFGAFDALGMISPEDLDLFRFAETAEEAWRFVEDAHP
ncbi:MAG: TIGR00730 family Rossman fold protein [Elusimicrobia bacterium CG_4_9_14_3_um_filter_62_55]|nr:MAG: TIGR00730 family Rossman fold protein [Elusimicrobia bacterium CG_4_10_14_0_2_um_filter_63_34]PJB24126.1 MAG: TIGR00730 family Rossman fold protein [Elusimicrobia bacterium CG_4_9_14_3_um_filter_62_55]